MGYLSCNAESAIATCDPYNWDLTRKQNNRRNKPKTKLFKIREFSYFDLDSATKSFSAATFLGKGSHGSVYKAVLADGELVAAVKRTTITSNPSDKNFTNCTNSPTENEIEILSRVRSPRLVNLLGFGVDLNGRKLIVVEFMPNGSLYDLLHTSSRPPGWASRVRLALQIARAVKHLHLSNPPVIHRDIKSSNVLIDADWNARLGDFGLALRGHVEDVRAKCTPPAGTLGYLDPGYLAPGDLSTKSDVFSFGILLLEMISGRNAIDMNFSPPSVVDWAAPLIRGGDYTAICDPRVGPPGVLAVIRQLAVLAARCVRSTAEKRPAMSEIVECLKAVNKIASSSIWDNLRQHGWRRGRKSSPSIKYEALDDSRGMMRTSRVGSRRNRKVSSVPPSLREAYWYRDFDQVGRSKSVGSVHGIVKLGPSVLESNIGGKNDDPVRKKSGLGVKIPMVRMSKSRSMGVLQSSSRLSQHNNGGFVVQVVRSSNVVELEESKLLLNL